jgi:hypothetical protein
MGTGIKKAYKIAPSPFSFAFATLAPFAVKEIVSGLNTES